MSCKEKIDKVKGIQSHLRFCFLDKIYRNLPNYLGFDWQKNNVVESIPLPVATIDTLPGCVCVMREETFDLLNNVKH